MNPGACSFYPGMSFHSLLDPTAHVFYPTDTGVDYSLASVKLNPLAVQFVQGRIIHSSLDPAAKVFRPTAKAATISHVKNGHSLEAVDCMDVGDTITEVSLIPQDVFSCVDPLAIKPGSHMLFQGSKAKPKQVRNDQGLTYQVASN